MEVGQKTEFLASFCKERYCKGNWRICLFETASENVPVNGNLSVKTAKKQFIAKGEIFPQYVGESLMLTGEWSFSKKDQEFQFHVALAFPAVPTDEEAKKFILQSVKGIGEKLAARIMEYCEGDLDKFSQDPSLAAASIKGLSERRAKLLASQISQISIQSKLSRFLGDSIPPNAIKRLIAEYGKDAYTVVFEKPYSTAKVIGFELADKIALAQKFEPCKEERIEAAILFALDTLKQRKCSIIVRADVHLDSVRKLLDNSVPKGTVNNSQILQAVKRLKADKQIVCTKTKTATYLYLYEDWVTEKQLADQVLTFAQNEASEEENAKFCAAFQQWKYAHRDIRLAERQEAGVYAAANLLSIITGGPGMGKTTVLKAIMESYTQCYPDAPIHLMAPTGLAAKRMSDSCGRKAQTIHKALHLIPAATASGFKTPETETKLYGLIVVDEVSMIGIHLASFLMDSIEVKPETRIVLVGDIDQLAPVTPGSVLRDLISSERVHVTRLNKNFRQAAGSNIADVATKINTGKAQDVVFGGDCQFREVAAEDILEQLKKAFLESVKKYGLKNTYVLSPARKSLEDPLSCNTLNPVLQDLVNPATTDKPSVKVGRWVFRQGDRVINRKNSEDGINGDIGTIVNIIPEDVGVSLEIDVEGVLKVVPPERLKNYELAYAITVHSSQGCEFGSVIMPVSQNHRAMLSRNLLYTAVTRAKKNMLLLGSREAFNHASVTIASKEPGDLLCARLIVG